MATITASPEHFLLSKLKLHTHSTMTPYFLFASRPWKPLFSFCHMNLTTIGTLYRWNRTMFILWCLISLCTMSSRFNHVLACVQISFLIRLNNISLYVYTTFVYLFIYPRHLGYFQYWLIVNNAAMFINSNVKYLFEPLLLIPLGIYWEMEFLGCMTIIYLIFWGTAI